MGDWTLELFKLSLENPQMPLWITAAQPSVLEDSIYFDNGVWLSRVIYVRIISPVRTNWVELCIDTTYHTTGVHVDLIYLQFS